MLSEERFEPHPDVVSQDAGGRTLLVHLETGETFALNATGQTVWSSLCEGATPTAIARSMSDATGAEAERVSQDVQSLLADLRAHGLLRPARA